MTPIRPGLKLKFFQHHYHHRPRCVVLSSLTLTATLDASDSMVMLSTDSRSTSEVPFHALLSSLWPFPASFSEHDSRIATAETG